MDLGAELLVIFCLTIFNGVFAGAEISLLAVRKTRLRELADNGSSAARAAILLRQTPERFLATVQVGITVIGAAAGAFGGATMEEPIASSLSALGLGRFAEELAFALVVALVSSLSIIIGELVPKSLALRSSERLSLLVARPLLFLAIVIRPIVWFFTFISNLILRPFRDTTTFTEARLSPEELRQLLEEASVMGSVHPRASDIAARAIDFGALKVRAILRPRAEVVTVSRGMSRNELWTVLKTKPHSRYPVMANDLESIEGYVMARDLVTQIVEAGDDVDFDDSLRDVPFVPESAAAVDALRTLQGRQTGLGVVVDEHGVFSGIVTLEDILEELVGEILAEHERPLELIRRQEDGSVLVLGAASIHDLNRELEIELPQAPGFATIAGLLLHHAGRMPRVGESFVLPGGVGADIVEASARRVRMVRLHLPSGALRDGLNGEDSGEG